MLRLSREYWKLNIHDKTTWHHWLKNLWAVCTRYSNCQLIICFRPMMRLLSVRTTFLHTSSSTRSRIDRIDPSILHVNSNRSHVVQKHAHWPAVWIEAWGWRADCKQTISTGRTYYDYIVFYEPPLPALAAWRSLLPAVCCVAQAKSTSSGRAQSSNKVGVQCSCWRRAL